MATHWISQQWYLTDRTVHIKVSWLNSTKTTLKFSCLSYRSAPLKSHGEIEYERRDANGLESKLQINWQNTKSSTKLMLSSCKNCSDSLFFCISKESLCGSPLSLSLIWQWHFFVNSKKWHLDQSLTSPPAPGYATRICNPSKHTNQVVWSNQIRMTIQNRFLAWK